MSLPRVVAKVVFTGSKIFGRALAEAGRQAVANARHRPEAAEASSAGSTAAGGDPAKRLTADLKMTLDEACMILNVKKDDPLEVVEKNYERIFAANSPPDPAKQPAPTTPTRASSRAARQKVVGYSHYLQSKVFRALERIKAEQQGSLPAEGEAGATAATTETAAGASEAAGAAAEGAAEAAKESATSESSTSAPPPPPPPPPKEEKQRTVKEGETISL